MHELPLLVNITLALIVAFIGGMLARRIGGGFIPQREAGCQSQVVESL